MLSCLLGRFSAHCKQSTPGFGIRSPISHLRLFHDTDAEEAVGEGLIQEDLVAGFRCGGGEAGPIVVEGRGVLDFVAEALDGMEGEFETFGVGKQSGVGNWAAGGGEGVDRGLVDDEEGIESGIGFAVGEAESVITGGEGEGLAVVGVGLVPTIGRAGAATEGDPVIFLAIDFTGAVEDVGRQVIEHCDEGVFIARGSLDPAPDEVVVILGDGEGERHGVLRYGGGHVLDDFAAGGGF